jgi:ParB/RepB/Spo0J family partition protein
MGSPLKGGTVSFRGEQFEPEENKIGDFEMAKAKASKTSVIDSIPHVRMIVALDKITYDLSINRKLGMDEESISQLADNIKIHGVLQNIILNDKGDGTFEVMGGVRRTMAARQAGLKEIPALVFKNRTKEENAIIRSYENLIRQNPSYIDRATEMMNFKNEFNWTQKRIAAHYRMSDAEVSKFLRLLDLPEGTRESIHNRETTLAVAFQYLTAKPEVKEILGDVASAIAADTDLTLKEKQEKNKKAVEVVAAKFPDSGITASVQEKAENKAMAKAVAKIEEKKKDLPPINLSGAAMPPKADPKTPSSISPPSRQPLPPLNQPTVSVTAEKRQKGLSREEIDGLLLFLEGQCSGEARKFISDFAGHIEGTKNCASRGDLAMILKSLEKVKQEAK